MDNAFVSLFRALRELWAAYERFDPEGLKFDEGAFLLMSGRERLEYLERIHRWFFGREGIDRAMIEGGALSLKLAMDYRAADMKYRRELLYELEGVGFRVDKTLRDQALEAHRRLLQARIRARGGKPASPSSLDEVLSRPDAPGHEVLKAIRGYCGFLTHGDGDRWLVENGGLAYRDLALVPLALWRYCLSLGLNAGEREFAERQVELYERMWQNMVSGVLPGVLRPPR